MKYPYNRLNKYIIPLSIMCLLSLSIKAQDSNEASYPLKDDVETLDGIIKAYYEVISGPAGQPRQWRRDSSLHHPDALITITGRNRENKPAIATMALHDYHTSFGIPQSGFWEYEVHREVQKFGNITHVWSTYETKTEENGPVVERGINSIQLYYDGNRWWILAWMFDSERPDNPIPDEYD